MDYFFILLCIIMVLILGFICWLIIFFIDTKLGKIQSGVGKIVDKEYTKGHYNYIYNSATKTTMPYWVDDTWTVYIQLDNLIGSFSLSHSSYNKLDIKQNINITYRKGIIFNSLNIETISYEK